MWILILFAYVSSIGSGNGMSFTNIPNFKTQQSCEEAGKASSKLSGALSTNINYVCVKQ
jgi:hypothetical protein